MSKLVLIIAIFSCIISGLLLTFGISKQLSSKIAKIFSIILGIIDIIVGLVLIFILVSS